MWSIVTKAFLIFCILVSANAKENDQEGNNMLYEKPYMSLRIDMTECYYDIYLNGVPILLDTKANPITVNLSVNHWMRSGENELTVYLYTLSEKPLGDKPECNITLLGRNNDEPSELNKEIMQFSYSGRLAIAGSGLENSTVRGKYNSKKNFILDNNGDVEIHAITRESIENDGGTLFKQKITLPLNLPLWEFFESDALPQDLAQIRAELYPYYEKIYLALKTKNVDSILHMFQERNNETDQAYFNPPDTLAEKIKTGFNLVANDSSMTLVELKPNFVGAYRYPNNKLARLSRTRDMSAIGYNFNDSTGSESYDLIFRKSGDKWILTR